MTERFELDSTLGAAFVGLILASLLHGVSIVQVWYYYGHSKKDSWRLKLLVGIVMVFDTVHEILIAHTVYSYTVTNWGKPEQLDKIVWSLLVEVIFNGLTAFFVQSFLAMRVWHLSHKKKVLTGAVVSLVLAEFAGMAGTGCLIAFTVISLHLETYEQLAKLKYLSILVNALAAAGDVSIAATLCILLHNSRTGFKRSDTMINKLILFSVNTGVLTSLCAIASLVSIVLAGNAFIYIAFFFCIGRLYTNSLLATLNARRKIGNTGDVINSTSENFSLSMRNMPLSSMRPANISIKIDTSEEFATDRDSEKDQDSNDLEKDDTRSGFHKLLRKCSSVMPFEEKEQREFQEV